jgi:SAM-dependent methyltransferase
LTANAFVPCISTFSPKWMDAITIKGDAGHSTVPPPIADLLRDHPARSDLLARHHGLEAAIGHDAFPVPEAGDREMHHIGNDVGYRIPGYDDYRKVVDPATRHGATMRRGSRVMELGCASGRVLRHVMARNPEVLTYGSDIKLRHIEWMRQFLPSHARLIHGTTLPTLPLTDVQLDVVYAYSVFSHIDDFETSWLAELNRCLRPGGLALLSIHSDECWNKVPSLPLFEKYYQIRDHIPDYPISPELFSAPSPREKTVIWWNTAESYNCDVFYNRRYIRRDWSRFFDVVEIIEGGHNHQDMVVLRKTV